MPVGKNSIKRVANNGYSNVKTDAPDMENSVINEQPKKTPKKKTVSAAPKTEPKKTAPQKKEPVKEDAPKPTAAVISAPVESTVSLVREGTGYVNLGGKLPDYLL